MIDKNILVPFGVYAVVKKIEPHHKSSGGILLTAKSVEESVLGVVIAPNPESYYPNGTPRQPRLQAGDVILFAKGSFTESPLHKGLVLIAEDCVYSKVKNYENGQQEGS